MEIRKYILWFFYSKNNRKHLAIAVNLKNSKNRIPFIKNVEITGGKTYTIYSVLSNKIEECGGVESLSWFGRNETSVIIGHKKNCCKIKKG